jgi:hypothetical protein
MRGGTVAADPRPFFREYADKIAPPMATSGGPPPSAPGAPVTLEVASNQVLRALPRGLFGNNAAVWDGELLLSSKTRERLRAVNVSILRFPGGSTADTYHWDGVYPPYALAQGWNGSSQPYAVNTAEYMDLVSSVGAIPLLTVNYGYTAYDTTSTDGSLQNAVRLAADWVEYCNSPNDGTNPNGGVDWAARRAADGSVEPYSVKYWEIGNEVFGSWEAGYDPEGSTYAANFNALVDAMKTVDPSIYIGLVVQLDQPAQPWTATVLSYPGTIDRADFLVVHDYFAWLSDRASVSATAALPRSSQVAEQKGWLDQLVRDNTRRAPESVPYYFGEYNVAIPTSPLLISLVSALFITKVVGEIATSGWAAASFWDVLNGYEADAPLGAGDLGFLARGQPGVSDFTPRPSYYAFYFFTRNFGDHLVDITSSDESVVAYASTFSSGEVGVVMVNQDGAPRSVTVTFDGFSPRGPVNGWVLTGALLDAQAVTLNGQGGGSAAGGPAPDEVSPYYISAENGRVKLDVPGFSVSSVVVY